MGSLPRPSVLQQAYARYDAGEIGKDALAEQQEAAIRDSIERFEATAHRSSPTASKEVVELRDLPDPDTLTGRPGADSSPAAGRYSRSSRTYNRPVAPARARAVHLRQPAADSREVPLAQEADEAGRHLPVDARAALPLRDPVENTARRLRGRWSTSARRTSRRPSAGAARLSVDFTRGASRPGRTRATVTGAGLPHFVELINRVMARFTRGRAPVDRRPHLPGRRPRPVHSCRTRTCCRRCSGSTPATSSSRWPASAKDPVLGLIGRTARRRGRRGADRLHRRIAEPARGEPARGRGSLDPRGEPHPQGAAGPPTTAASPFSIDEATTARRLRPGRGVQNPEPVEGTRLAAEKLGL